MSMKELANDAITRLNVTMESHIDSRCATTQDVDMAAMACRIQELEKKALAISEIVWAEEIEDAYSALNTIQNLC